MKTVTTREDVLTLFMEVAGKLEKTHVRQDDTILQLAQVIADSQTFLPEDSFTALVNIGATLYKANHSRKRARSEIATTMRKSIEGGKD